MNNCSFSKSFPQSIINQPKFSKDSEPIFFFFFFFESHIENLTKPKQQKLQNLKTSLLYFQIWVWIDIYIYIYCKVTICSPNPEKLGYKPNEPNTINL